LAPDTDYNSTRSESLKTARQKTKRPPLWRCQQCGRSFANRNQSHACGRHKLQDRFDGKPPEIRALFKGVAALVKSIGPVRILPEKTRIAFQVRMSFAQVTPRQRWLDGHVVLARRLEHPRFRKIETFSPRNHLHAFRLTSLAEIDAEFHAWIEEAYRVGEQRHLPPTRRAAKKSASSARLGNRGGMTAAQFRSMALSLPGAIESAHMNHPDFRVGGKIFATLGGNEEFGVVMLSPDEQREFVAAEPKGFAPVKGGWGRSGSTEVHLETVRTVTLRKAMTAAWRRRAPIEKRKMRTK